jgi:hypothetical protein
MLKELKLQLLRWAKGVGLPALVRVTQWHRYPLSHAQFFEDAAA